MAEDPMVRAGEFRVETHSWLMPADVIVPRPGAIRGRSPRSPASEALRQQHRFRTFCAKAEQLNRR
jgi:hypothetical protein